MDAKSSARFFTNGEHSRPDVVGKHNPELAWVCSDLLSTGCNLEVWVSIRFASAIIALACAFAKVARVEALATDVGCDLVPIKERWKLSACRQLKYYLKVENHDLRGGCDT